MKNYLIKLLTWFLLLFTATNLFAQSLPDSTTRKIDSLFVRWDNASSPGCAIGIVRNDSLIYAKGYGMANLEYGIPITPETIFDMASVSKQFTGYCIILLARKHKLSLDDDIHKYLSWFPDLKEKITIRNLLNHTSGIHDFLDMLTTKGTKKDDVVTTEMGIKVLSKLQVVEFTPGNRFSYSNSNYILLAEIIKSVSGKTLRQFADSAIFQPLHMMNTHFNDNYTEIVKNRALSYERIDGGLVNSVSNEAAPGASSLYTNIDDMAKWLINFSYPKAGDKKDIAQLTQKGKLNNGKEIFYASGIAIGDYKGSTEFYHEGGFAGYRTVSLIHPDIKLGLLIFSNDADCNVDERAFNILNFFIPNPVNAASSENIQARKIDTILTDVTKVKVFEGNYISDNGSQISFSVNDAKLYVKALGQLTLLSKDSVNTFSYVNDQNTRFSFVNERNKNFVFGFYPWLNEPIEFKKFIQISTPSDKLLQEYVGAYYTSELDVRCNIILQNHNLTLSQSNLKDAKLTLSGKDDLLTEPPWVRHFSVIRNNRNHIIAIEENNGNGRINRLRFNKID